MSATIHVPSHNIAESCDDDAKALHVAVLLRAQFPGIEVIVEFSNTPARQEAEVIQTAGATAPRSPSGVQEPVAGGVIDLLEIPGFLRRTRDQRISQ